MLKLLTFSATGPLICSVLSYALFPVTAEKCVGCFAFVGRGTADVSDLHITLEAREDWLTSLL